MKGLKQTKAFATATAAAMLISVTSTVPAITASAIGAKTVNVTLPTYSGTVDFSDISQADYKTTSITLTPNFSMTIDENTLTTAGSGEYVQVPESSQFSMNFNDSTVKANIVSAIETETGSSFSVDSADDALVNVTGYSINYSWTYTTTDETLDVGIVCWSNGYGDELDCFTDSNTYHECAEKTGSGSINSTAGENSSSINKYDGLWLNAGVYKNSDSDCSGESLTFTIDSVALNVSYSLTGNGGYKSLGDDGWSFDLYMDDQGTINPGLIKAIQTANGDTPCQWPITINDITVDYEWDFKTANDNPEVSLCMSVGGNNTSDEWQGAYPQSNLSGKTGNGTINAVQLAADNGVSLAEILSMGMGIGTYTETTTDTLTLKLTSITVNVTYSPDTTKYLTYSELQGAQYLDISFNIAKKTECSHSADNVDHIGDDGQSYYESWTYCPWAGVEIYRASSDGTRLSSSYTVRQNSMDTSPASNRVTVSDIYAVTGALSSGERLAFSGGADAEITNIEILASVPDIELGTGSITSTVIEENYDWDAVLGSVPTGEPNLKPTIQIANNFSAQSFKDYSAIKIDYTLDDPDACSGIIVILHGWEDDSVGWMDKYYPVSGKSGSIVTYLSGLQDKTYHNIYVGPTAKPNAQIGDSFAPGFTITDAKILASYTGTASAEIEDPTVYTDPVQAVDESPVNSTVEVAVDENKTIINSSVFEEAKSKNLTLELTLGNGVTWTISASSVNGAVNVDIDVKLDTTNIPQKDVAEISAGKESMQISLAHEGSFGFNANISIPVEPKHEGKKARLYHYKDDGSFEYIASAPVKNGKADLPFKHASEYVILFDEPTSTDPVAPTEPTTPTTPTEPTAPTTPITPSNSLNDIPPFLLYPTNKEDVAASAGLYEDSKEADNSSAAAIVAVCAVAVAISAAAAVKVKKAKQK